MQVDLAREVFCEADALPDVLNLLRRFAEGPHDWVADPATIEAAKQYLSEQAPHLADTYIDLAHKGVVAAAWSSGSDSRTVVRIEPSELADYTADLCRPAVLVVEDQESDGCFVRALSYVFRADGVLRAVSRGWLEIEHGGGSSIDRVAQSVARRYRRCVRVAALLDSDRMIPGQKTSAYEKADQLTRVGIVVHVLELREAENYVPNRVLITVGRQRDASRRLDSLKKLTLQQRGYLDIKKGFGPTNSAPVIRDEQADFFRDLDQDVLVALRGGFGMDLLKRLEEAKERLTERDFASLGEDAIADLRALLAKLVSVI